MFGHTPNDAGEWQTLDDHLHGVSDLCREFAEPLGFPATAAFVGAVHDIGKAAPDFQAYLYACDAARSNGHHAPPRGPDHKAAGAALASAVCESLAIPLVSHHGGLVSPADTANHLAEHAQRAAGARLPDALAAVVPSPEQVAAETGPLCADPLQAEVFLRMLYSVLVDADSLDTESHTDHATALARCSSRPTLAALLDLFNVSQTQLAAQAPDSEVNQVRREVYEACCVAAAGSTGVFRLTVPTGGGKTRSSLAFALRHAVRNRLARVIYAIPYTSIIDQTAEVFRGILGPNAVVEHHSAINPPSADDPTGSEREMLRSLSAENWDAPLIVTTTVQLFESLFSRKRSACRKVHNIAGSVLILDEVQTLPAGLLEPIVDMLRTLTDRYRCSVVLCTATQPALSEPSPLRSKLPNATEIVPEYPRHFAQLSRVRYEWEPDRRWAWADVAEAMGQRPQCLAVVNTKNDALALLNALDDPDALHLSTLLCGRHRLDVIRRIREALGSGRPCRVVSTEVIEAGVDVDFPSVFRAIGPLDRIIQAAGRCNREGRLGMRGGEVIVFEPSDGGAPPNVYRTALDLARAYRGAGDADLDDPDLITRYFRELFHMVSADAHGIQGLRTKFLFRQVHEAFRMIPDDTVPVIVRYRPDEADSLIAEAVAAGRVTRDLWRRAQGHCVSVARREFGRLEQAGLVREVIADSGLYRWDGGYDETRGITGVHYDPADLTV